MVVTWCTDPSQGDFANNTDKFSSYYQYDTVSLKLVRIRLELNRSPYVDPETQEVLDAGDTQVILNKERAVGFSTEELMDVDEYPNSAFSMSQDEIYVNNDPLSQAPSNGDWVIDMSSGDVEPHFGNRVTTTPNLPEGIETKHLSLLANQAIIDGQGSVLTTRDVTPETLSEALKNEVSDIIDKPFDEITDDDILSALKSQVTAIKEQATQAAEDTINSSLDEMNPLIEQLNEAINDGSLVPSQEVDDAYDAFQEALGKVSGAMNTTARTAAIADLQTSHDTLINAMYEQEAQQADVYQENFDRATDAVEAARQASQRLDEIPAEYESTEQAKTIAEYEESMNGVEEV